MNELKQAIDAIEHGLLEVTRNRVPSTRKMELSQRMKHYKIPGFSVAFVYQEGLARAKGFGMVEAGSEQPMITDTIFQAASISKPVTAMVALHLVEAGLLDLDADANDFLSSWKIPKSKYFLPGPDGVIPKVTLRGLLSLMAGAIGAGTGKGVQLFRRGISCGATDDRGCGWQIAGGTGEGIHLRCHWRTGWLARIRTAKNAGSYQSPGCVSGDRCFLASMASVSLNDRRKPVFTVACWGQAYLLNLPAMVVIVWFYNGSKGSILVAGMDLAAANTTFAFFPKLNGTIFNRAVAVAALILILANRIWRKLLPDHPAVYLPLTQAE